jgi:hypothetical protein
VPEGHEPAAFRARPHGAPVVVRAIGNVNPPAE